MAKRIQFAHYGSPEVMDYVDFTPPPPEDNEIQIANKAIGLNFIDTYYRRGIYNVANFPSGLGTEAAGIVVNKGKAVTEFAIGDRVVYGQATLGAYSEYHNVATDKVVKLPNSISFEQAASCFMKGLTVYYLFFMTYPIKKGEIILFHAAAGGVGYIACQWAKLLGAKLIGTAGSEKKIYSAHQAGAWQMINYNEEDIAQRVVELTHNEKVNVVYDSVGKATWLASLDCLKPQGVMVSFGNASGEVQDVDLSILAQKGSLFVTRPTLNNYINNKKILQTAANLLFQLIEQKDIQIPIHTQQLFSLKEARLAHNMMESRKTTGSSLLIP